MHPVKYPKRLGLDGIDDPQDFRLKVIQHQELRAQGARMVNFDFCEDCGSDEEVLYCSFHKRFLCLECDLKLHEDQMRQDFKIYP
jgi:hypothetical protein